MKKENKTKWLTIRLTPAEKEKVRKAAMRKGQNFSDYLKELIFKDIKKEGSKAAA